VLPGRERGAGAPAPLLLVLGPSTGGIGGHVRSLAEGLTRAGHRVVVAGPPETEALFAFSEGGATFCPVPIAAGLSPLADLRAARALRAPARAAVVVHAHGYRAGVVAGLATPRWRPLVVSWHNAVLGGGAAGWAARSVQRRLAGRADVTLGASSDLVALSRRLGAGDARLLPVAAPALPPAGRAPEVVRAELGAADRPLVLAVGRLAPQKRYDLLLTASARWQARAPRPLVLIAGDGSLGPELQRRIDAEGLPIRLLGRRSDVADLLGAADVVVLASDWEARALVAQEALRAGRPLVATAVGGLPELVDGAAALVPPGDAAALAAAVTALLDDPARAAASAARGQALAATWPGEADTVRAAAELYAELAGR